MRLHMSGLPKMRGVVVGVFQTADASNSVRLVGLSERRCRNSTDPEFQRIFHLEDMQFTKVSIKFLVYRY